jgi:CheY-like chemotaxis protein
MTPEPDPSTLRILVADDNRDTATSMALLLQTAGFSVVAVAHDGRGAFDAIQRLRPKAAILDIVLPDLDGYEIAKLVRKLPSPRPKLIAVSGLARTCDRLDALEAGFHAHFTKPVEWQKLQSLLLAYAALPEADPQLDPRD